MENVGYPRSLILGDSQISIYYETGKHVNKTKNAIVIEGNRTGFLTLSNLINVYNVYLYNPITITEFTFINSKIVLNIFQDETISQPNGIVVQEGECSFNWKISEINLFVITGLLHSLGYANSELHFDSNLVADDISIYCVVK